MQGIHSSSQSANSAQCLVNQFQRELDLPRCTCRLTDLAKAGAVENVRRQAHVDDVKQIEELGADLHVHTLRSAPLPDRCVFDEREIIVVVGRPAERVAAQRAKTSLVRSGAVGHAYGNEEEIGGVVGALPEVVLAYFSCRGEMRFGY